MLTGYDPFLPPPFVFLKCFEACGVLSNVIARCNAFITIRYPLIAAILTYRLVNSEYCKIFNHRKFTSCFGDTRFSHTIQ